TVRGERAVQPEMDVDGTHRPVIMEQVFAVCPRFPEHVPVQQFRFGGETSLRTGYLDSTAREITLLRTGEPVQCVSLRHNRGAVSRGTKAAESRSARTLAVAGPDVRVVRRWPPACAGTPPRSPPPAPRCASARRYRSVAHDCAHARVELSRYSKPTRHGHLRPCSPRSAHRYRTPPRLSRYSPHRRPPAVQSRCSTAGSRPRRRTRTGRRRRSQNHALPATTQGDSSTPDQHGPIP